MDVEQGPPPAPEVWAWVDAVGADVERDPRLPAGTTVVRLRMYDQTEGGSWSGWALGLVGVQVPDDATEGPIWRGMRANEPPVILQVWALRAGPRGSQVQVELRWRPGMGQAGMAVFGAETEAPERGHDVLTGGYALLGFVTHRDPRALPVEVIKERLYGAWTRALKRTRKGDQPTERMLCAELCVQRTQLQTYKRRLARHGVPWPPPAAPQ